MDWKLNKMYAMKKQPTPYRSLLDSAVRTRKHLLRTGRSMKQSTSINTTIMRCEELLMRMPSEETVKLFLQRNYQQVRDLIPARGPEDKRIQLLQTALQ